MKKLFPAVAVVFALLSITAASASADAPPTLDGYSFSPAVNRIDFSGTVTPNSETLGTDLRAEYFAKQADEACADHAGGPSVETYYGPGGVSPTGLEPVTMGWYFDGLNGGTVYCVRLIAHNDLGDSNPGAWTEVTTITKAAPTLSNVQFSASASPDPTPDEAQLSFVLNDSGAYGDTSAESLADYSLWQTPAISCTDDDYGDGTQKLVVSNFQFSGEQDVRLNLDGLTAGAEYCLHARLYSSWGAGFEVSVNVSLILGAAPSIAGVFTEDTEDSVTIIANLTPGFLTTSYAAEYFAKPEGPCADYAGTGNYTTTEVLSNDLAFASQISATATGLSSESTYCIRFVAENQMGGTATAFEEVTTASPPDTTAPSTPTGLVASNVTQTSALLTWNSSTDNASAVKYSVQKNGSLVVADATATSLTVALTCGTSSSFTVTASDLATNTSPASTPLVITGLACDVVTPPGNGGTVNPPAKQCLAPIAAKSVSGKFKKGKKKLKYSLKISGKVAADGQSIKISAIKKNVKFYYKVDGKSFTTSSITVSSPSLVTVIYKPGSGTNKMIKIQLKQVTC